MSAQPVAIMRTGLVTAVGLTAERSCAAFRAKLTNPTETMFMDSGGEWIMAHQVSLASPVRGIEKLASMAELAIREALGDLPRDRLQLLPLLLCVAEQERPGREEGLDDELLEQIQHRIGARFANGSSIVALGRVAVVVALGQARSLLSAGKADHVLVVATDSLVSWPTLGQYERQDRLLTARNSNGFARGSGRRPAAWYAERKRRGACLHRYRLWSRSGAHSERRATACGWLDAGSQCCARGRRLRDA